MKKLEGLQLRVPGPPVGKGRPRVVRNGGTVHAYTPEATRRWERKARKLMQEAWGGQEPLDEPVLLEVYAVAARPKRLMRKSDPDERLPRTTKPDGDNVLKSAADAFVKARVLRDDALIVEWRCLSLYAAKGERPRTEMSVRRWKTRGRRVEIIEPH